MQPLPPNAPDVTGLLRLASSGDPAAQERLLAEIEPELRRVARRVLRGDAAISLQPTLLIDEAFLRLVVNEDIDWEDRAHFYRLSAHLMRQLVVQNWRRRNAAKRSVATVAMNDDFHGGTSHDLEELVAVHQALLELERLSPRQAEIVSMRVFAGLSLEECAAATGISRATVVREWRMARAWLTSRLA